MKIQIHIILFIFACFAAACNDIQPQYLPDNHILTDNKNKHLTASEAAEYAIQAIETNFKGITRSILNHKIQESYLYQSPKSRGNCEDSVMYIVNFEDGGFALVGASKNLSENLILYSEKGYFDPYENETSLFLTGLVYDLVHKQDTVPSGIGGWASLYACIPGGGNEDPLPIEIAPGVYCRVHITTDTEIVNPKLCTFWGQGAPYNKYCIDPVTGTMLAAGCGPVAIAQVLGYYRKPINFRDHFYPWDEMLTAPYIKELSPIGQDWVAWLIRDVGILGGARYGETSTSMTASDILSVFKLAGFDATICNTNDLAWICAEIREEGPLCFMGTSTLNGRGHAWVIDGYRLTTKTTTYRLIDDNSIYDQFESKSGYFHCNWGWGSSEYCDFYIYGNFDVAGNNYNHDIKHISWYNPTGNLPI